MLHEQQAWLAENRVQIAATIDEGYIAAQRGELIEADAGVEVCFSTLTLIE
ncbi:MAG: hypothetical protein ACHP8A_14340 [Terriglobales bacterium]